MNETVLRPSVLFMNFAFEEKYALGHFFWIAYSDLENHRLILY